MGRRLPGQRIQPILAPAARLIWKNLSLLQARRDRRPAFRKFGPSTFGSRVLINAPKNCKMAGPRSAVEKAECFFHRAGPGRRLPWGTAQARLRLIWPTGWQLGGKRRRIGRPRVMIECGPGPVRNMLLKVFNFKCIISLDFNLSVSRRRRPGRRPAGGKAASGARFGAFAAFDLNPKKCAWRRTPFAPNETLTGFAFFPGGGVSDACARLGWARFGQSPCLFFGRRRNPGNLARSLPSAFHFCF